MNDAVAVESRKPPRSLIISPNLEALLEHEDRIQQLNDNTAAVQVVPESPSIEVDEVGSLPPPPRKARRTRGLSKFGSPQFPSFFGLEQFHDNRRATSLPNSPAVSTSPATPNPYINPAPTLDEILRAEEEAAATVATLRGSSTTSNDILRSWVHDHDDDNDRSWKVTRPRDDNKLLTTLPRSAIDERQTKFEDLEHRKHITQQSVASLPRVEKLLRINRNTFGRLSDGATLAESRIEQVAGSSNIPASPTSPRELPSPRLPPGERPRSKAKLVKRRESKSNDKMKHVIRESVVLDIRRQDTAEEREWTELTSVPTVDIPWRRRPLLSHAAASSSRSSSGSLDLNSDTTHDPTSAEDYDPHISISSTIYPPSSAISHPISMYNTPTSSSPRNSFDRYLPDRQSFIDILSPSTPGFPINDPPSSARDHPANPSDHRPKLAVDTITPSSNVKSRERTRSPKPPIPTTPKPVFNRKNGGSRRSSPKESSPARSTDSYKGSRDTLPPTTNFLDMGERAELIKKSRKLTQVFGQTPGAEALALSQYGSFSGRLAHHRGALSVSNNLSKPVLPPLRHGILSAEGDLHLASLTGRRHSLPLSPDEMSFLSVTPPPIDPKASSTFERQQQLRVQLNDSKARRPISHIDQGSRTSFIDLSDEEIVDDGASVFITPKKTGVRRSISPSTQSLFENMTPEEQAEEERRRKRERLAKLHRFLGSRVPANLVLGVEDPDNSLPPICPVEQTMDTTTPPEDTARKIWLRRRRSSSAAVFPSTWSDDLDRMKEELNDKEKAINVRRALKMEKVFGVAPPQTLYHTRHSPSPSVPNNNISGISTPVQDVLGPSFQRNPNRSSYTKTKSKKSDRPGTAESSQALLPKNKQFSYDSAEPQRATRHSFIYNHYQHSLNSLNDILDRDDRESLAELHQYLSGGDITSPVPENRTPGERRVSNASIKSERRRSLPARTSLISLASEYSITSPKPDITDFQIRRRRAAKLTQFFGVDYRELITDVLESIEQGLEHEQKRGTLQAEEVEDLLARLRELRVKREGIF